MPYPRSYLGGITKEEYMVNKEQFLPNITLDEAKELVSKWQKKCDDAMQQKIKAQSLLFDMLYPNVKGDEIKALVAYYKEEVKSVIASRDKVKREIEELRAECYLLKTQVKNFQKEKENG